MKSLKKDLVDAIKEELLLAYTELYHKEVNTNFVSYQSHLVFHHIVYY